MLNKAGIDIDESRVINILVIEDEKSDFELLKRQFDINLRSALLTHKNSAPLGLSAFEAKEFDCVLVDLNLPGASGLDLVKSMREIDDQVPIILLTGQGSEQIAVSALKVGVSDYETKDIAHYKALPIKVRYLVSLARMQKERHKTHAELSEADQQFADFAAIATDFFWETNDHLEFTYLSKKAEQMLLESRSYYLNKPIEAIFGNNLPDEWLKERQKFERHEDIRNVRFEIKRSDKNIFISLSARALFSIEGKFLGYRGIGRDVTDEVQLIQKLEKANHMKEDFLNAMSHDLRTPLNAIIGFSMHIASDDQDRLKRSSIREYAGDINVSAQYLLGLVSDVLEAAELQGNHKELQKTSVSVAKLFDRTTSILHDLAAQKDITLSFVKEDELPNFYCDEKSMMKIIVNLCSNGIKYSNKGGKVECEARIENGEQVIRVRDNGIGIKEDLLEKIFLPFVRDKSDSQVTEQSGSGLGLTIVKQLVELQEGTITLKSAVGKGTTVEIRMSCH